MSLKSINFLNHPLESLNHNRKGFLAFYSPREHLGPKIRIWVNTKKGREFPDFDGKYGEINSGAYIRKGPAGGFIAIFDNKKLENGKYFQIATARVVCNSEGIPKLAIHSDKKIFWAEVAKKVPVNMLVACGLDLLKMNLLKKTRIKS